MSNCKRFMMMRLLIKNTSWKAGGMMTFNEFKNLSAGDIAFCIDGSVWIYIGRTGFLHDFRIKGESDSRHLLGSGYIRANLFATAEEAVMQMTGKLLEKFKDNLLKIEDK